MSEKRTVQVIKVFITFTDGVKNSIPNANSCHANISLCVSVCVCVCVCVHSGLCVRDHICFPSLDD